MTDAAFDLAILAGTPSPAEAAAIRVVLGGMIEELTTGVARDASPEPTAWSRSQRPIRTPIVRGHDRWRGFSG